MEGAVPVANLFLNSVQCTLKPLGNRDKPLLLEAAAEGSSLVVAGIGRRVGSIGVADGGVGSVVSVPWRVWELDADGDRDWLNAKRIYVRHCRQPFAWAGW